MFKDSTPHSRPYYILRRLSTAARRCRGVAHCRGARLLLHSACTRVCCTTICYIVSRYLSVSVSPPRAEQQLAKDWLYNAQRNTRLALLVLYVLLLLLLLPLRTTAATAATATESPVYGRHLSGLFSLFPYSECGRRRER